MRRWPAALVLLLALVAVAATTRVSRVLVTGDGDYGLTASTSGTAVTLQPGDVHALHINQDASAGGWRITNVFPGVTTNDALVYGQPVTSPQIVGSLPNLTLRDPLLSGTVSFGAMSLAGTCAEAATTVFGARKGMAVAVSAMGALTDVPVAVNAYVLSDDRPVVRVCSVQSQAVPATTYRVTIVP